jgi:hypothetical protein
MTAIHNIPHYKTPTVPVRYPPRTTRSPPPLVPRISPSSQTSLQQRHSDTNPVYSDNIQLLLVLDHTTLLKTSEAQMNATSFAQSVMDDFSIGDYLGVFNVDDHVRKTCSIRKLEYKNRFDVDINWVRAEVMDWRGGNHSKLPIHKGVETALRDAQKYHGHSKLQQRPIPIIVVVITDGSKWALSSVLTSKGFLSHISLLPICQRNIVQIFICTATYPPAEEHGRAVLDTNGTIFRKTLGNSNFTVYLKDISNVVQCARTKWIFRLHLHDLKSQQCKAVIQNISKILNQGPGPGSEPSPGLRSSIQRVASPLPAGLRSPIPTGLKPSYKGKNSILQKKSDLLKNSVPQ